MRFFAVVSLLVGFQAFAASVPNFEFIGTSSKERFKEAYGRAARRLATFSGAHKWRKDVDLSRLIERVEVYSEKKSFDQKLIQLSDGKMTAVPKTFVGVADKKVLRVLSWPAYRKIHPRDSENDYEKLLAHEMAHQLHVEILSGDENLMGPVWFFEGFAVLAAGQYQDFELNDRQKIRSVVQNPERGDYKSYGAILRQLVKSKPLPELVEMAKAPDFSSKAMDIFK